MKYQALIKHFFTIMRAATLVLLVICTTTLLLSAEKGEAQEVDNIYIRFSIRDASLEKTIRQIEKLTPFRFIINESLAKTVDNINFAEKKSSVRDILTAILEPRHLDFEQDGRKIIITPKRPPAPPPATPVSASATTSETARPPVKGRILNEKNEPLAGVSIQEKGTSVNTVSADDGSFTINVADKGAILIFSYVGMGTQEIAVDNKSFVEVRLKSGGSSLNDVVVVGYGTQKKVDLTGSVSSVKGSALTKAPMPNLSNALAGKMTGVISTQQSGKPGFDDPQFFIRGKSTFGDNGALILVDGIERPAGRVDPNEIESVTILKDAASAAVYGARAANGVILITTKRGVEGKPKVSFTSSVGSQQPARLPALMNAYEYATYLNMGLKNLGSLPRFSDDEIAKYKSGALPSTDWWKESLNKRAAIYQDELTISGGSGNVKYFVSLGYLDQKGLYDLSWFKRYNLRSNLDIRVTKNLRISVDIAGRLEKTNQSALGDAVFNFATNSKPTERAYTPDSIAVGGLGSNGLGTSPIGQARYAGYNKTSNNVAQSTVTAVYDIPFVKGLSAKVNYSFDPSFAKNKIFSTPFTFYEYNKTSGDWLERQSGSKITLTELNRESSLRTLQASLNYDRKFGKHGFTGLFLFEQTETDTSLLTAYREGFLSGAIDQIFAGADANKGNGGSAAQTARRGYIGRVNYNYADRYLLQANFRYDGSFNFPPAKRWGFFPAFSAGWRINKEAFMQDTWWLSNLKLRASYGRVGNDRVPPYQYLSGFSFATGPVIGGTYQTAINDNGIANPNITWETADNTDLGLEFGLLNDKFSGEVDYFYKRTKNILLPRNASIPASFGATLPSENIGVVDNRGIEIVLRYKDNAGKFFYNIEGNMTYAKSKIIFMDEPADVQERVRKTGRPLDQYYGYGALGLFQTQKEIDDWADQDGNGNKSLLPGDVKYQDYNKDGKIDGFDIHYLGESEIPRVIFGLNLSASYKGFDLTANLQGATGFKQYFRWDPFNLESNALRIFTDSWTETNTNARFPRLYAGLKQNNRLTSSFWLFNGTYMKLRNVELAYTFRSEAIKKAGINGLRVFMSGNNLLTLSAFKDFDPEAPSIDPGSNMFYYPQMKAFNLGVNVEF